MRLRPMLGHLRRVAAAVVTPKLADHAKAAKRTLAEDVREYREHLRDVKAGK